MSNSEIDAGPSAASDAAIAEPTPPVPTTRQEAPAITKPLRFSPRVNPSPSNMSPASVPSGRSRSALQDPAILTVVLRSSSSSTTATLCGIVTSAPWKFVSLRSDARTPAKSPALTPIGTTAASIPFFSNHGL